MFALVALVATLHLSVVDNNGLFFVNPGQPIVVTLPSNSSTGYSWSVTSPKTHNVIRLVKHTYVPSKNHVAGAPGKDVWRFVSVADGQIVLSLGYARPWLRKKPVRRFSVTIRVR